MSRWSVAVVAPKCIMLYAYLLAALFCWHPAHVQLRKKSTSAANRLCCPPDQNNSQHTPLHVVLCLLQVLHVQTLTADLSCEQRQLCCMTRGQSITASVCVRTIGGEVNAARGSIVSMHMA